MFQQTAARYPHTVNFLLNALSLLVLIPLAPYINRFIPTIQIGEWNLDMVLSLLIAFFVTRLILRVFKPLIIPAFIGMLGLLAWTSIRGDYGFGGVYRDYKNMVMRNWVTREEKQIDVLSLYPHQFESLRDRKVKDIRDKMSYQDSVVRNFSVLHSLDYFDDAYAKYGQNVRFLSLFRYIRTRFKYVPDAKRDEYFATPRETILNGMGGDCDDHAILMASCMRAIGAITRIVIIRGHAYPELFCGDKKDFEEMKTAILQLFNDPPIENLYFHEYNGQYWINLDYTAMHPGGPYLNDEVLAVVDW